MRADLLAAGDRAGRDNVHMLRFTKKILEGMTDEQRVEMIEMLWEVAYADGILDPEEDSLIRRIAGLIYVTDRDRVLARKKVVDRLAAKRS